MIAQHPPAFVYDGYRLEAGGTRLTCRYSLGGRSFEERFELLVPPELAGATSAQGHRNGGPPSGGAGESAGELARRVDAAGRLVHLLAGVSYYKTAAPPRVDLGCAGTIEIERRLLVDFYREGLGEFAFRNHLDLSSIEIVDRCPEDPREGPASFGAAVETGALRPLVPFGGGIDSVVTVEEVRRRAPDTALLVVEPAGRRFAAIEEPAAVTGLPVIRVRRHLDPQVLRSGEEGFLNGHVPVTGILSAVAVWAAAACGRHPVVMANEWSASDGNVVVDGRSVNHQWSKSQAFEDAFRAVVGTRLGGGIDYFSLLRARSELWVAQRFAALTGYHRAFRSCNRAFHIDPEARLDRWCGRCDKCCFVDLVLAPFMGSAALAEVFGGSEPLEDPSLLEQFRVLIGAIDAPKPFECVGERGECRTAVLAAAERPDRRGSPLLQTLAEEARRQSVKDTEAYLRPLGPDHVPDELAPPDLLV